MRKLLLFIAFLAFFVSCEEESGSKSFGECESTIITTSARADDDLYIVASFNKWHLDTPMIYRDGRWEVELSLPPGDYGYKFYSAMRNEEWLDPENPMTMFADEIRSSRFTVKDCRHPELQMDGRVATEDGGFSFDVKFISGINGANPDFSKSEITLNGEPVTAQYDKNTKTFKISHSDLDPGKYTYLFRVWDSLGFRAKSLFVPIWVEKEKFRWSDAILYQILTDRFSNGDVSNDKTVEGVDFKANWQGGDFRGVIEKIDSGYFIDMGINALWISSPIVNTQGLGKGMYSDPHYYTAYHSYWPIGTGWTESLKIEGIDSPIEPHFGSEDELKELIKKAHAQGIRVLFDFVPNHVHIESPLWEEHRNHGWFNMAKENQAPNQSGGYNCGWEDNEACWFTEYLPDINYRNIDALNAMIDHAIWLAQEFDVDGYRLDAIRLMVLDFTYTLKTSVQRELSGATGNPFYMVGETFTGHSGHQEIGWYLGEDMLDGQFDFPLFHYMSDAFLTRSVNFQDLKSFTDVNDRRYQNQFYAGAVMSNFLGNHDVVRAISVANDDFDGTSFGGAPSYERAWENSPETPDTSFPFLKMRMAHTFLFTTNGIPTIYMGDEYGMPGADDPDNRRMTIFDDQLNQYQKETLEHVKKLGKFRQLHPALRHGERETLSLSSDVWIYSMLYGDDFVIVAFNRSPEEYSEEIDLAKIGVFSGLLTNPLTGTSHVVSSGKISVTIPADGTALFAVEK